MTDNETNDSNETNKVKNPNRKEKNQLVILSGWLRIWTRDYPAYGHGRTSSPELQARSYAATLTIWRYSFMAFVFSSFADDDTAYIKAVLRLTDKQFTAELNDPSSKAFKNLSALLEEGMKAVYRTVVDFRDVNVVGFRYVRV